VIRRRNRGGDSIRAKEVKPLVNRSALVVKPQAPFLDWLHGADPTSHALQLQDLVREPTIYLIPECETRDEVARVLQELCEEIFVDQLEGWHRDQAAWPKDRSFDVFRRWFDIQHHSILMDLCDDPLIREV
jgi:hypothetical protein